MTTSLKQTLQHDLTESIRARDAVRSATLRMALTAVTTAETAGTTHRTLSDAEVLQVLTKEAKKRKADALKALDKEAAEIADREAALDARMTNTEGSTAANPKPKPTGGAGRTLADTPSKAPAGAKDFSSLWK